MLKSATYKRCVLNSNSREPQTLQAVFPLARNFHARIDCEMLLSEAFCHEASAFYSTFRSRRFVVVNLKEGLNNSSFVKLDELRPEILKQMKKVTIFCREQVQVSLTLDKILAATKMAENVFQLNCLLFDTYRPMNETCKFGNQSPRLEASDFNHNLISELQVQNVKLRYDVLSIGTLQIANIKSQNSSAELFGNMDLIKSLVMISSSAQVLSQSSQDLMWGRLLQLMGLALSRGLFFPLITYT